ncbi:hypothetical protein C8Q75DRAFT_751339 [Abortiporus biennis]|nr:hypothetical protein C8Q75DRAFT_751339 [Abortiporus biennis]
MGQTSSRPKIPTDHPFPEPNFSFDSSNSNTSLVAVQQAIEYHEKQASLLKQQVNSLRPISKLPPEILTEIFFQYAFECFLDPCESGDLVSRYPRYHDGHPYYSGFCFWDYNLRRVCRRWRQVIRQSSVLAKLVLWIDDRSIFRVQMRGARKLDSVALKATGDFRKLTTRQESLKLMFTELPRAEMCIFELPRAAYDDCIPEEMPSRLPFLTHLWISDKLAIAQECYMPILFFNSYTDMPKLRDLRLSFCTLDVVDTIVQPQITRLFLRKISAKSTVSIQEVLKKLPNLEVLDLDCAVPDVQRTLKGKVRWNSVGNKDIIHLPRLQSLRLRSTPTACANLILYLRFLPSTKVDLRFKLKKLALNLHCTVFVQISSEKIFHHLETLGIFIGTECQTISLLPGSGRDCFYAQPVVNASLWASLEPHESLPIGSKPPDLRISFQGAVEKSTINCLLGLPLTRTKSLCIGPIFELNDDAYVHIVEWFNLLAQLRNVEQLKVFKQFAWFIPCIHKSMRTNIVDNSSLAPKLKILILEDVRFIENFFRESDTSSTKVEFDQRLVKMLEERKDDGMELDQVVIKSPLNIINEEDYVEELSRYTKNGVVWYKNPMLYIDESEQEDLFSCEHLLGEISFGEHREEGHPGTDEWLETGGGSNAVTDNAEEFDLSLNSTGIRSGYY